MSTEHQWSDKPTDREKLKYSERKARPRATLATINPTRIGLGLNPDLHGEKQATNCLRKPAFTEILTFYTQPTGRKKIKTSRLYLLEGKMSNI
jgi:hypothetical protein